ncbi:hypothetical protein N7530_001431 [Penicillium desertorum]|uniref:Uncharacterized protein n=1 Tax=Penicillium desertorum TaxID=1303715 RepID=A0A9W9XAP3_9EURO|nr:hypothetical protein N7530_001431 [Penicillium desertorum]
MPTLPGTPIGLLIEIDQHVQAYAVSPHAAELCRTKPTTPLRYDGLKHAQSEHVLPNGVTIFGGKSVVNELADIVNAYDIWPTEGNTGLVDIPENRWREIPLVDDLAEPRRTPSEERPEIAHYGVPITGFEEKKTDLESDVAQALGYMGCIHRECKDLPKRGCTVYGMASNGSLFAFLKISHDSKSTLSVRGGNFELPLGIPVYMLRRAIMSPTHSKESSNQSHTQVGSDEIDQALSTVNEDRGHAGRLSLRSLTFLSLFLSLFSHFSPTASSALLPMRSLHLLYLCLMGPRSSVTIRDNLKKAFYKAVLPVFKNEEKPEY